MKKIIFASAIAIVFFTAGFAQCDKKNILTASLTEYLDSGMNIKRTVPEKTIIKINKSTLTITPGDDPEMAGTIKSTNCNWKLPYKQGKTVIKAVFVDPHGDIKNATVTIE